MSKTKTKKTVNKFTKALDFNLARLKSEKLRLKRFEDQGIKAGLGYKGVVSSVENLERKVANLYGIVSGSQDFIKFSRTSNWSNPLNKLGIGPHSGKFVPNTFALTKGELQERYPTLAVNPKPVESTSGALTILNKVNNRKEESTKVNNSASDNKDFKTNDHLDNARNYLLKDRSNERNLKDQLYIKNLQKR